MSNLDSPIPQEALLAYGISENANIIPFDHPWSHANTFRVQIEAHTCVMRCWPGGEGTLSRMRKECTLYSELYARSFTSVPQMLCCESGEFSYVDQKGTGWTAYEYVDASSLKEVSPESGKKAGTILSELHKAGREIASQSPCLESRLARLPNIVDRMLAERSGDPNQDARIHALGRKVQDEVLPKLGQLQALPRSVIHGDFCLENILSSSNRTVLVDFEFARIDVRILDFAAAMAPMRILGGGYKSATTDYLQAMITSYNNATPPADRLDKSELSYLHAASVAHFCFVQDDFARIQHPHRGDVISVLENILSQSPSAVLPINRPAENQEFSLAL